MLGTLLPPTPRSRRDVADLTVADLFRQGWPTRTGVDAAAAALPWVEPWAGQALPERADLGRPEVMAGEQLVMSATVSPGTFGITVSSEVRRERSLERAVQAAARRPPHTKVLPLVQVENVDGFSWERMGPLEEIDLVDDHGPKTDRRVTEWSRKSRSRLTRAMCEYDFQPLFAQGVPVMVTLTYPGDWQTVAPDGKTAKKHMRALASRWERAWGWRPKFPWKLETQRRGAPHLHLYVAKPEGTTIGKLSFGVWLSHAWAEIVNHPDPEQRRRHLLAGTAVDQVAAEAMRDPRRLGLYFLKHSAPGAAGSKEYQHQVPESWLTEGDGPGRFWGFIGLERATQRVELDVTDAVRARRLLRRYSRAQGRTRVEEVTRVDVRTGEVAYRTVTRRSVAFTGGRLQGGWVMSPDGPALAYGIGRWLKTASAADR